MFSVHKEAIIIYMGPKYTQFPNVGLLPKKGGVWGVFMVFEQKVYK